jgi:Ala-tRNA(Pro) deacylase
MQAVALPTTPDQLLAHLAAMGIATHTVEHAPVFTVAEAQQHRGTLDGTHIKNLFVRNKKKRMWLVVALENRLIDLKQLGAHIGAGHVSFGSPERLMQFLGVAPGSVTPFGVINDRSAAVEVVLDAGVLRRDPVFCHPLSNDMTTAIAGQDLLRFLEASGHPPRIVDLWDVATA